MLTDAHCHPFDLAVPFPQAERERLKLGVIAAASACDLEEFSHNEKLALQASALQAGTKVTSPLLLCFAVHPQMLKVKKETVNSAKETLNKLAAEGKIAAVGECGFDLFNAAFKETEKEQENIFQAHLETALQYDLPVVIHVRRAIHKIFAYTKSLKKCKAVVFHSWPGTLEEGQSLLRRGVNAYFSFGNSILNGHKQAIRSCAAFPSQRLLTETDAPFQPRRAESFSQWADLPLILEKAACLRGEDARELENQIEVNFKKVFC